MRNATLTATLEAARQYLTHGWSVIPVLPRDKKPAIPWKEFQERLPTDEELVKWFGNGAKNNIGIVTGSLSNLAVIDLDSDQAVAFAREKKLARTPTVKTGRGFHAYCQTRNGVRNFQQRDDLPDIDLRADGGYVVAPPSIHKNGSAYEWVKGRGVGEVGIKDLPSWVLAEKPEEKTPVNKLYKGVENGSRNKAVARLAGSWVSAGGSLEEIQEKAHVWNSGNTDPLPHEEVDRTIKSIYDLHHGWESPIPFEQTETPEIESSSLPSWLGDYARAVSENTQTPPAMAVLMGLSVIATCVQKRFSVSPYGDDYVEPLSIWTVTILPPATRKTAVLSAMTAPLSEWEREKAIELKEEIAENETIRMVNGKTIDRLQHEASKCSDHDERKMLLYQINELKLNTPEEMYPPRLWTGDVTPERLQNLLAEHGERMSVLTDEGGIFEIMSGLYSNGVANMDVFLKGHAGSAVRVDRGSREAYLDSPALTFGLTVQPEIISQLSHGNKKHFRGNGTLARFLYALPKNNIGQRDISQRKLISEKIKQAYHAGIFYLLDIMDKMYSEQGKPKILMLDHEARESWLSFAQYIESNQGEGKEFESIQDWTGKLAGASLRIAGLCHVIEHGDSNLIINQETVERSLDLCEKLIIHAQATFELLGGDQVYADARYVLKWVIEQPEAFFKRSDCQQALRSRFRRVDRLIKALEVLSERNYISSPEKLTTKKPTVIHHINPRIFEEAKNGLA